MDTLEDYIRWMGDFPIAGTGFREADALVLCALSYIDFAPLFSGGAVRPQLKDCLPFLDAGSMRVLITGSGGGYLSVLRLAAGSRRFGELSLSDYVDVLRQEQALQFAALCFHDVGDVSFMAFRGTDSSLVGWKEDFMIAVKRTEAQALAHYYALEHLSPGRRWYLGGHSKGGNLALYAAAMLGEEKRAMIERVFDLDGPGFCPDVLSPETMAAAEALVTRIIPRFSVVGQLFEPQVTDTRIVRSSGSGFLQHSVITWGIDHGRLALSPDSDPTSVWLDAALNDWIRDLNEADRIALIDDLFEALTAGGAENLEELVTDDRDGREAILRRLVEFSAGTRRSLNALPKYALRSSLQGLRELLARDMPGGKN